MIWNSQEVSYRRDWCCLKRRSIYDQGTNKVLVVFITESSPICGREKILSALREWGLFQGPTLSPSGLLRNSIAPDIPLGLRSLA